MKKTCFLIFGRRGFLTSPGQRVQVLLKSTITLVILSSLTFGPQTTFAQNIPYKILGGHRYSVDSIAFSPDGSRLASRSGDRTIRLWDGVSGAPIATLKGHTGSIYSVVFSPDGSILASGSSDNTVRLWDGVSGELIATLKGHTGSVNSIAFNPDGSRLASGSGDGTVRLWDGVSGDPIATLEGHTGSVRSVVFSPDGSILASGSGDRTVRLWDGVSGDPIATLEGHTGSVRSVVFSPDGSILASGSWDDTVRLWDGVSGDLIATLEGHTGNTYSVVFSPDGSILASGSADRTVRLWDGVSGEHIATLEGHTDDVNDVVFSPDGNRLASGSDDDTIRLWSAFTGEHIATLRGHTGSVISVVFSPDGSRLASGSNDRTIRLWDVNDIDTFTVWWNAFIGAHLVARLEGHTGTITDAVFSPDGSRLASGSEDNTVRLWDATTGEHLATLEGHRGNITDIAFSPDGSRLAASTTSDNIHLWNAITGAHLATFSTDTGTYVSDIAFSPDGSRLFTLDYGGRINIRNSFTGERIGVTVYDDEGGSSTWHLIVSPDSGGLEIGHKADSIALATRLGIMDNVKWAVFSPDGSKLVTGDGGSTIYLWDLGQVRGNIRFAPSTVVPPAVGSQMTVNLAIVGGEHVAGYQASVWFDPTALRYIKSTTGAYLPANAFFAPPKIVGNKVTLVSTSGTEERDGDGILATLTFEVVAAKTSTLTLSDVILSSNSGEIFYPAIENARVLGTVGDVSGDGVVNVADLVLVSGQIGEIGENSADVNGDGVVNIADLVLVAGALGDAAAAPAVWNQKQIEVLSTVDVQAWLTDAQQLNLTDAMSQRGISFLETLLAALTPKETQLLANYPNPFNPETWIPYQLAKSTDVKISIYAADGKLIRMLDLGHQPIGTYQHRSRAAHWDGKNALGESVASGVYFYTLTAGDFTATRKMLIQYLRQK